MDEQDTFNTNRFEYSYKEVRSLAFVFQTIIATFFPTDVQRL